MAVTVYADVLVIVNLYVAERGSGVATWTGGRYLKAASQGEL